MAAHLTLGEKIASVKGEVVVLASSSRHFLYYFTVLKRLSAVMFLLQHKASFSDGHHFLCLEPG